MPSLAEIQDAFAEALLARTKPMPAREDGAPHQRSNHVGAYRHNAAAGLVSVLATRFPVVRRLVGDTFFRTLAHAYAMAELPRLPLMLHYGETFPTFIEGFAPIEPIPCLADVARIETARGLAGQAADATPLDAGACATLPIDRLGELQIRLHPSVSVITSQHPVYSIWHVNRDPDRFAPISPFAREAVLVARPHLRVRTLRITHEIAEFIRALAAGKTIGESVDAASAATSLAAIVRARIVIGIGGNFQPPRLH
jgi:hypothetical protein